MSLMNLGLPNQPDKASPGGLPVGYYLHAPSENPLLDMADGSRWLRAGLALPAADYPDAQALAHLRAHRFTRTARGTNAPGAGGTGGVSIATNGAGTFVAVVGSDTTNLYVSFDHGQTWQTKAHNIVPNNCGPCAIVWTGTRFVAVGNDTVNQIVVTTSPDGNAWTAGSVGSAATSTSIGIVELVWNGSLLALMYPSQNTAQTIWTSATGLAGSWTARATPNGATVNNSRLSAGGLGFVMTYPGNNATGVLTSPDGINWTNYSLPSTAGGRTRPVVTGTGAVVYTSSGATGFYSTDLINWSNIALSTALYPTQIHLSGGVWATHNAQGSLITSTDGINWVSQVAVEADGTKPLPAGPYRMTCLGAASMVCMSGSGVDFLHCAMSTLASPNGVGGVASTNQYTPAGMWRIK